MPVSQLKMNGRRQALIDSLPFSYSGWSKATKQGSAPE